MPKIGLSLPKINREKWEKIITFYDFDNNHILQYMITLQIQIELATMTCFNINNVVHC